MKMKVFEKFRQFNGFPRPGKVFYDIQPMLDKPIFFMRLIEEIGLYYHKSDFDCVVGIDATGIAVASAISTYCHRSLVMVQSPDKSPAEQEVVSVESGELGVPVDAVRGKRCVVVSVFAQTGRTERAVIDGIVRAGGRVLGVTSLVMDPNKGCITTLEPYKIKAAETI